MKLIAESGSTIAEWALVENDLTLEKVYTEGINPFFQSRREISRSIRLNLPEAFFKRKLEQVYYYGTGCSSEIKKEILSASLVAQFRTPALVESDLLAAARGLFKRDPGIACILGAGSNSCFYNGEKIVKNVRPAGYILGDEGGEAVLGKLFLADALKDIAPESITRVFFDKFRISPENVIDSVYNSSVSSRFLTTVSYFLADYLNNDYVYNLYVKNLRDFFSRCICQYDYQNYRIRFVGSFAFKHSDILEEVADEYDIRIDMIRESPMSGLIEYHSLPEQ